MGKYYLCEFHEQNGEFEYNHHHIYSDEFLKELGIEKIEHIDIHQCKLLNQFFGNIEESNNNGNDDYWTHGRLVSYVGLSEVKSKELNTFEKGHIYCD